MPQSVPKEPVSGGQGLPHTFPDAWHMFVDLIFPEFSVGQVPLPRTAGQWQRSWYHLEHDIKY